MLRLPSTGAPGRTETDGIPRAVPPNLLRIAPQGDLWWVLFDASPVACSIVDITSGQVVVNRAYRSLLAVPEDVEVTMEDIRRRTHPDERDELNARFGAMDRGEVDRIELDRRYVREDGGVIWGHLVTTLVRDEGGAPVAVVGQMEDITERVEAQRALAAREARFRSLVHNAADMVVVVDADGRVLYGTAGLDRDRPNGAASLRLADLLHVDDADLARALVDEVTAVPFARASRRVRLRSVMGEQRAEAVATNLLDDTDVGGIVVSVRVSVDPEPRSTKIQRFEAGFEHSPIGSALVDPDGVVDVVNPALCHIMGAGADELTGRSLTSLLEPPTGADGLALGALLRHERDTFTAESRRWRRDGSHLWLEVHVTRLTDPAGAPSGFFAQFQDVTARRVADEALAFRASHDTLTGLANRQHFLSVSGATLARVRRPGDGVAILFVDVDRFKVVNDSFGHETGDQLLAELAQRLTAALPAAEVARLGGDEFGVMALVPRGSRREAHRLAERLHEACTEAFEIGGRQIRVSLSIGIVCVSARHIETEVLLRRADAAMYRAKSSGRATTRFLDAATLDGLRAQDELAADLGGALARDELFVAYQPEVDLRTGAAVAVEAYVRWRHPRHGELPAARFVTAGDATGHLSAIGAWVLRQAVAQAVRWPRSARGQRIVTRVNVGHHQFSEDAFAERAVALLDEAGLDPADLTFEVPTEALVSLGTVARRNLCVLGDRGLRLSIDHVGAGPLVLTALTSLPAAVLKVDRTLIHAVERNRRDRALVAALVDLGERLGLDVVAEGIETERQAEIVASLGCRYGQGHLFGAPATGPETARRLGTHPGG